MQRARSAVAGGLVVIVLVVACLVPRSETATLADAVCHSEPNPTFRNDDNWTRKELVEWCRWVLDLTLPTLGELSTVAAMEVRRPDVEAPLATFPAEVWAYREDGSRELRLVIEPHNGEPTVRGIVESYDDSPPSLALRWERRD